MKFSKLSWVFERQIIYIELNIAACAQNHVNQVQSNQIRVLKSNSHVAFEYSVADLKRVARV